MPLVVRQTSSPGNTLPFSPPTTSSTASVSSTTQTRNSGSSTTSLGTTSSGVSPLLGPPESDQPLSSTSTSSSSTTIPIAETLSSTIVNADEPPSSTPTPASSSGSTLSTRPAFIAGILCGVLGMLLLLAIVVCYKRRRHRSRLRRAVDAQASQEKEASPSPAATVFPISFTPLETSSDNIPRTATLQDLRTAKLSALVHNPRASSSAASSTVFDRASVGRFSSHPAESSTTSANRPPASVGSTEIERQFQASLEARAESMGLTPRQLLMLLTTSLDNQHGLAMSDVASSDITSERAFSLVSLPPPEYDAYADTTGLRNTKTQ